MNTPVKMFLTVAAIAVGVSASARTTYVWVPGATDWADSKSYTLEDGGPAPSAPGYDDILLIPENCDLKLDAANDADWAVADRLYRISPTTATSYLTINVTEGERTLNAPINVNGARYDSANKGGVVKTGAGTLILGTGKNFHGDTGNEHMYYYCTSFTVMAGTLKLPQEVQRWSWRYYDMLDVREGATLVICTGETDGGSGLTAPYALAGTGTITSGAPAGKSSWLEIQSATWRPWNHEFAGKITGNIMLINGCTSLNLTGEENDFTGGGSTYGNIQAVRDAAATPPGDVYIGLKKIGNKADVASSAGNNSVSGGLTFADPRNWNRERGSGYRYLGTGETTDKDIIVSISDTGKMSGQTIEPNYFDAGTVGGLTFTGALYNKSKYWDARFMFTGDNQNECVAPYVKSTTDGGTNHNFRIIKDGTGVWRFTDKSNDTMNGVFEVRNGTLRYDSICELGTKCSLGTAALPLDENVGPVTDERKVDYAIVLGTDKNAEADPVFEYAGAAKAWSLSRRIALKGSGRLRHSGSDELRLWGDFKSLTSGAKTLTLDGSGANATLQNALDENGNLSLVKDGTGDWTIVGTNTLSGSVTVRNGTLKIANEGTPFTWFRFTFKGTYSAWMSAMAEFGLFDVNGERQNKGLTVVANPNGAVNRAIHEVGLRSLPTGRFAWGCAGTIPNSDYINASVNWMDGDPNTYWNAAFRQDWDTVGPYTKPVPDNPDTWFKVTMRLADGAKAVTSYDLLERGGWQSEKTYGVRAWDLEGSVDGINWEMLDTADFGANGWIDGCAQFWRFGEEKFSDSTSADVMKHTTGKAIAACMRKARNGMPDPLANVANLTIGGGTLIALGERLAFKSGLTLTVAPDSTGALRNVSLPKAGTVALTDVPEKTDTVEMSVDLTDAEGAENVAEWAVSVNGTLQPKWAASYANGKLTVKKIHMGLAIIVR